MYFAFTIVSIIIENYIPMVTPKFQGMKLWIIGCRRKQNDTKSSSEGTGSKNLTFLDLIVTGIGSCLGIGISVLIGGLIKNVTGPAVILSVFIAGVTALIGGFCCAEFGVRFLKVDSAYAYSYFWGRENVAFVFGWVLILEYVAGTASAAKGIITFIDALSDYKISVFLKNSTSTDFPDVFPYFDFLSFGIVIVVTVVIAFEVKDSLRIKQLFTIFNVILIVSIIVGGTIKADMKNWQTEESVEEMLKGFVPFGILSVIKGAAITFYGFIGFDTPSISGEEIKKRKRNLPLASLVTIVVSIVAYVGVGVVLSLMVPYNELDPFAAVPFAFQRAGWISFKWVVAVATFFGFQTSLFGAIFLLPKTIRAMANDGLLFSFLGNSHSKFKTPIMASLFGGLMAATAAGIFPFQKLVNLTIIAALFVYTILAINLILLRYSPTFENDDKPSDSWTNLMNENSEVSVKQIMKNYFNFKIKQPTNLTKIIMIGNLVLFCISSVGISIIFNIFYGCLAKNSAEAVVPASILLIIMFLNLISITCQPKSQGFIPFKVFLVPFIPCLSIFLNIFLMITLESLTWIIFSIWMAIGIFFHLFWHFFKCFKGEMGKNSLFDINKTNAVKLNESIWKIKSDKKSFYEGAINPVFSDDLEDKFNQVMDTDVEIKKPNRKGSLQLKQAEIIQTAESVLAERTEPLENDLELNFICVGDHVRDDNFHEDEKVQWECVAEIHTKEELPQESVALEIVDDTYNFLSEVSEDMTKDGVSPEENTGTPTLPEKYIDESETTEGDALIVSVNDVEMPKQVQQKYDLHVLNKDKQQSFKEELLSKVDLRINNKGVIKADSEESQSMNLKENQSEMLNTPENMSLKDSEVSKSSMNVKNQNPEQFIKLIVETFYKPHPGETILRQNKVVRVDSLDSESPEIVSDEQNKIKEFKEKLNKLLKDQINSATLGKSTIPVQLTEADGAEKSNEKKNEALNNSIKTLNKSQIKGKLEFLLSKGPPKRPSLGSSFNLKLKQSDNNTKLENTKDEILSVQNKNNSNSDIKEENFGKSSDLLPQSMKEKLLSLSDVEKLTSDVCC